MRYLFLLFFIPGISSGQDVASKTAVKFLSVERAMSSLVMVTASSSQIGQSEQIVIETVGFIAQDSEGNIGVVTSFGFINKTVNISAENFIMVYNKANNFFSVEKIKNISPNNNLVFLKVKGDLTEGGRRPPLSLADSHRQNEPLFYALRAKTASSPSWFQIEAVQRVISLANRLDFLVGISYKDIKTAHKVVNVPVLNQKGELVSFVSDGADYTLYGVPLEEMRAFLQSPEDCSFVRGCIIEARRALYKRAFLRGDSQASYMLMLYTAKPIRASEAFMHSIGETYSVKKVDWDFFRKDSANWDARFFYYWLISHTELSKKKRKDHFEFLEQESSVKQLAEQGHPHFQYFMGSIYLHLENPAQAEYWFRQSARNGYIPGLWEEMRIHLDAGLSELSALSGEGHTMARQIMVFLGRDFTDAISFIKKYNEQRRNLPVSKENISPIVVVETSTDKNSRFFESLAHLERGLDLLQQLVDQSYNPAKKLQRHFKRYVQEESETPIYVLLEKLGKDCRGHFVDRFMMANGYIR